MYLIMYSVLEEKKYAQEEFLSRLICFLEHFISGNFQWHN